MGNYNPHVPIILGQEWVPIRDEDIQFSPNTDFVELGHSFVLSQDTQVKDARYYLHEFPAMQGTFQTIMMNVYPRDMEALTGPIKQVLIPVNNGGMTGSNFSLNNAASVAAALQKPGDGSNIQASYNSTNQVDMSMFFAVNSYPQLADKRILNVSFVYTGYLVDSTGLVQIPLIDPDTSTAMTIFWVSNDTGNLRSYLKFYGANAGSLWQLSNTIDQASGSTDSGTIYGVLNMGDVNPFSTPPYSSDIAGPVNPWRYVDLQRYEASAGPNRLHAHLTFQIPATGVFNLGRIVLEYAALKVTYCDETRVLYGGFITTNLLQNFGANTVTLRDRSFNANPILPAGDYTVTISAVHPGDLNFGSGLDADFPKLNGLRQLYALPEQRGVQINIPTPLDDHLGETFTKVETQVLPQISLHSSGGPITPVHVYGRQVAAQVYGSVTATQKHLDPGPPNAVYPLVRFYARRFGDTTVPLVLESPSVTGNAGLSAQITPMELDALPEIIDGWKEVNLTFTSPPTLGKGINESWRWRATGEFPSNRYEILGASAPALSGVPGNSYSLVPSPNQLYNATYQPPSGSLVELNWLPQGVGSPPVTATSDDDSSDAVLMFSQYMPTITGFTVSTRTQTLVGIGLNCGINPCCVPSALLYNRITWPLPANTGIASDDFNRVVAAGGWGTASDGHVWTISNTAADFSVNGSAGLIKPSHVTDEWAAWVNVGGVDQDVKAYIQINDTAETNNLAAGLVTRLTDINNHYAAVLWCSSTASRLVIHKRVATVKTDLVTVNLPGLPPALDAWRWIRFQVSGTSLRAKVWGDNSPEPDWMAVTTDSSLTTGNNAGTFVRDDTAAAGPSTFKFDNFSVNPPDYWFGSYELQRMDTVSTTWQTIMRATAPYVTGFNDYEARVGLTSSYRIRGVNVYDFAGPWSSTVSIAIPSPGASGGCLTGGHILLFSSNERQDGSVNLAYSSVWEDHNVREDFAFPEASFVQMQAMYNRDNFIAFRPTERGGEQFQRTVLVQAAAISPPTLADFTSLRDMAWADTSYICVRDEDGNRWFATVLVPGGKVTRSRKLYLAPVTIIEVTDTPSEADPVS
jgi:hypothetical protein